MKLPQILTTPTAPSCELVRDNDPRPDLEVNDSLRLADHTSLRIGGPAKTLTVARTVDELVKAVATADETGEPVLILGAGSNVVVADEGFNGTLVIVATTGINAEVSDCAGAYLTVAAGEPWDDVVAHAVDREWVGLEALSGIPGATGATPIQNVGAYGAEVADTIASVRTWDRVNRAHRTFAAVDCGFGYRSSIFKREPGRYVVLSVSFQLELGTLSAPIRYAELAARLGVKVGERAPAADVRQAVIGLRRGKGMVLDPVDHDTWSAGSFFTNPVLAPEVAAALPAAAPRFPQADGNVKTSAAWLIEHAGFGRGFGDGPATLSTKHTLAITNRGSATAADVLELARKVRDGVKTTYGVELVPEPALIGCEL